ncbi:MAG TPA: alpha/beta hydrolase [Mycobacterium sp.]|nr:alpha/beta hydrolase [Mycobacterium sp.]
MNSSDRQFVDIGDRVLCARVRGRGPTVVLEAGGAGEGTTDVGYGEALEERLAGFATVLTYDRAGSGRSDGAPRRHVAQMADDLAALIDSVGCATPAVVVGWSSGGLVAEMFAVRHRDKVAGLVLLDPTCDMPTERRGFLRIRLTLGTVQLWVVGLAAWLGFFRTRAGRSLARQTAGPYASSAGIEYFYRSCNYPRTMWQLARIMPRFGRYTRETAAALDAARLPNVPVRVVVPRLRSGLPPTYARQIDAAHRALAERFPRGELVLVDNASHAVPIDRPDVVVAAVREVLGLNPATW